MINVIDNFIGDDGYIDDVYIELFYNNPHFFVEVSEKINGESPKGIFGRFYSTNFPTDDSAHWTYPLYLKICDAMNINPNEYYPIRINSNIQYIGMGLHSIYHNDPSELTAVYFVSPDVEGGEFVYLDEFGDEQRIEYMRDRLVYFNGKVQHKAMPPTNISARVSLAFKISKRI